MTTTTTLTPLVGHRRQVNIDFFISSFLKKEQICCYLDGSSFDVASCGGANSDSVRQQLVGDQEAQLESRFVVG